MAPFLRLCRKNPQPDKTRILAILKIRLSALYQHYVAVALIAFLRGAIRSNPADFALQNPQGFPLLSRLHGRAAIPKGLRPVPCAPVIPHGFAEQNHAAAQALCASRNLIFYSADKCSRPGLRGLDTFRTAVEGLGK
jgi:hypothetical protein